MIKLYGGYIKATNSSSGREITKPITVTASSFAAAICKVNAKNRNDIFPTRQRWANHQSDLMEVPTEQLKELVRR